tara:strand:- start:92219 stop:92866 length:648 start_codon:yes stop_codon:yes gene_type:complete
MKKIVLVSILSVFSFFLNNLKAENIGYNNYRWTDNHPLLLSYVKENKERILEFTPYKLKHSQKYSNFINSVLKYENVPKEILVLAGIESGFRTNVESHSQAVGMWQFLELTAEDWGLRVNKYRDDREDWKRSTIAAVRYIKWMAENHFDNNYEMAILAYNAGIGRVNKLRKKYNTNDPWILISKKDLPSESREYLPKFLSYMHYFYFLKNNKKNI